MELIQGHRLKYKHLKKAIYFFNLQCHFFQCKGLLMVNKKKSKEIKLKQNVSDKNPFDNYL